jgi:hypothetical protein
VMRSINKSMDFSMSAAVWMDFFQLKLKFRQYVYQHNLKAGFSLKTSGWILFNKLFFAMDFLFR